MHAAYTMPGVTRVIALHQLATRPARQEAGGASDQGPRAMVASCADLAALLGSPVDSCPEGKPFWLPDAPGDVATVIARLLAGRTGAVERHPQVRSASGLAGATVRGKDLPVDADGEFQASTKLSQAAAAMSDTPGALQLRLLQTVTDVAAEKNSTLVMPFPVELLRFFERAAGTDGPDVVAPAPAAAAAAAPTPASASASASATPVVPVD